jgi:hypothetical protein
MTRFRTTEAAAARAADILCLAAAPVFAVLALLTASGGDMLCTMPGISALSGMSVMYWLMSLFHAAPWLRRLARPTCSRTLFIQPNTGD